MTLTFLRKTWPRPFGVKAGAALALAALAAGPACAPREPGLETVRLTSRPAESRDLMRLVTTMDPSMRALASRHDPFARTPDLWGRPEGWSTLDLRHVPDLGLSVVPDGQAAVSLNALRPFSTLPIRPMRPFVLQAVGEDRARAVECLSQAVYYEAAREPQIGQEAVAQVVLNRVRHPAYPKSVCGVVFQGAARATGCQFTFTCDGSLRYTPQADLWRRARAVAERALNGYVDRTVGSATHYHAEYVSPYWAPTLVKMTQVGQHIFYRWTGPWGEPAAFTGRYAGGEAYLSPAVLGGADPRLQGEIFADGAETAAPAPRTITLAVAGEVRTYNVVDPTAPAAERGRTGAGAAGGPPVGALLSTRRQPTPEEIRRINQSLEAMEREMDQKPAGTSHE